MTVDLWGWRRLGRWPDEEHGPAGWPDNATAEHRNDPAWRAFLAARGIDATRDRIARQQRDRVADRQRRIAEHARTHRCSLAEAEEALFGDD